MKTDQKLEDDVLRQMLATPPTPHKPVNSVPTTPKRRRDISTKKPD